MSSPETPTFKSRPSRYTTRTNSVASIYQPPSVANEEDEIEYLGPLDDDEKSFFGDESTPPCFVESPSTRDILSNQDDPIHKPEEDEHLSRKSSGTTIDIPRNAPSSIVNSDTIIDLTGNNCPSTETTQFSTVGFTRDQPSSSKLNPSTDNFTHRDPQTSFKVLPGSTNNLGQKETYPIRDTLERSSKRKLCYALRHDTRSSDQTSNYQNSVNDNMDQRRKRRLINDVSHFKPQLQPQSQPQNLSRTSRAQMISQDHSQPRIDPGQIISHNSQLHNPYLYNYGIPTQIDLTQPNPTSEMDEVECSLLADFEYYKNLTEPLNTLTQSIYNLSNKNSQFSSIQSI